MYGNDERLDNTTTIVNALSELIMAALRGSNSEKAMPVYSADDMDAYIAATDKRAKELRRIREEFEDIMAQARE